MKVRFLLFGFFQSPSKRRGFSLIEMMWQLVILVVVSFPMVMALNMQKESIEKDETQTRNQVLTNSLFAVVNPQDADWFHRYDVNAAGFWYLPPPGLSGSYWLRYTEGTNRGRRPSIYCDKANPALEVNIDGRPVGNKGQAGYVPPNPCFINTSFADPAQSYGANANRPPFFERTLERTTDNKLKVTVKLYEKPTRLQAPTPFYESAREFDLLPYRVQVNNRSFPGVAEPALDDVGNLWSPDVGWSSNRTGPDGAESNRWGFVRQYSCSAAPLAVGTTALPAPSNVFWQMDRQQTTDCTGAGGNAALDEFTKWLSYRFRVTPGTYNVNLYFYVPETITTGCLANTANMSCALADIAVSDRAITTGGAQVSTFYTFDTNAVAGPEFETGGTLKTSGLSPKVAVFRTQFTTTRDEIRVYLKPTRPDVAGPTTTIRFSGIEVMRRGQ